MFYVYNYNSVTDVTRNFSDYLNRADYGREHFLLFRGEKVIAEINHPPKSRMASELPERLDSLPELSKNNSDNFISEIKKMQSAGLEII